MPVFGGEAATYNSPFCENRPWPGKLGTREGRRKLQRGFVMATDSNRPADAQQGPVATAIADKLRQGLPLQYLELENESHMHSVPPGSESHFKATLVSDSFDGRRQVARHQLVYGLLADELRGPVHALALHTYTPAEWAQRGGAAPASPECMGGSKHDHH